MDGQTKVVSHTLSTLLQVVLKMNLKLWEESLPHVEFAYNRAVHSTIKFYPFEIVYGFKPAAPIDLLPFPMQKRVNFDTSKRAEFFKKLHERAKINIEKMTKMYRSVPTKVARRFCLNKVTWFGYTYARIASPINAKASCSPVQMDHSKCFTRSTTMLMKLIVQVHMVLVQVSASPICLRYLDLKSRGRLLFKRGG
jgi:hypothetical protein